MEINEQISEEFKNFKFCPCCGKENTLEIGTNNLEHINKQTKKVTKMEYYVYKCNVCKESFTTTLSDTISFDKFKK